jgi:hypothetical protein
MTDQPSTEPAAQPTAPIVIFEDEAARLWGELTDPATVAAIRAVLPDRMLMRPRPRRGSARTRPRAPRTAA